jgi:hypothetical protein
VIAVLYSPLLAFEAAVVVPEDVNAKHPRRPSYEATAVFPERAWKAQLITPDDPLVSGFSRSMREGLVEAFRVGEIGATDSP